MKRDLTLITLFSMALIAGVLTGCSCTLGHKNNSDMPAEDEVIVPIPVTICYLEDDGSVDYMVTNIHDEQENTIEIQYRTCSVKSNECECTVFSGGTDTIYKENGRKEFFKECDKIDSTGKCITYKYGVEYVFDSNKNILSYRHCRKFDVMGKCTAYNFGTDHTYDSHGNLRAKYNCCIDKEGQCSSYAEQAVFTYDAEGNLVTAREYKQANDKKQCTIYEDPNSDKVVGAPKLACPLNRDKFDDYSRCHIIGNYDVAYDKTGVHIKMCDKVDNTGKCTSYSAQK